MQFKVTCFFKETTERLFQILEAKHFVRTLDQSIVWTHKNNRLEIVPFSAPGRETNGYRFYYEGSSEVFQFVFNNLAGKLEPTITGVESTITSALNQKQLINLAKQTRYRDCSMPGLYELEGVGIVLMKNGEINFQLRNRHFTIGRLHEAVMKINRVADQMLGLLPAAEKDVRKGRALA